MPERFRTPKQLSPMMQRIYEKAETLPPVIDPETNKKCWDEAWTKYVADTERLGELGYRTVGNTTLIQPVSEEAAREINDLLGF